MATRRRTATAKTPAVKTAGVKPRAKTSVAKATEGAYRDGPYYLPLTGGWLGGEAGNNMNWWQLGYDPYVDTGRSAMVEACVSAYSQTVAMCPGDHWKMNTKGGRDRITTSALSRWLRRPNSYQSTSDFLLNTVRSMYTEGEAFALALRNDRFEVEETHLMRANQCEPMIAVDGDIFYQLGGNEIISRRFGYQQLIVPARDVLHLRLHTPNHPLKGVTPLMAVMTDIAASGAMSRQQLAFYMNQARPSTVLTTDLILDQAQADMLRDRWNEQSKGLNAGGTPILGAGLKPMTLGSNMKDAQLAEVMKLTDQNIALAFRMPLQILGIGGTPFASTEAMMQFWLAGGLNFALNHLEVALDHLFGLKGQPEEYTEFNTRVLLRSAFKDRIESYAAGTRAGIFAPNEARSEFELASVADGDEPRMQQQDVPLSYGAELEPNAPAPEPAPPAPEPEPGPSDKEIANDNERIRQSFRRSHTANVAV